MEGMIGNTARRMAPAALVVFSVLIATGSARAQSTPAAKEGRKLAQAADAAQAAVEDLSARVREAIAEYNAIVYGSAKNPETSFNRLSSHRASVEKKIAAATRSVDELNATAEPYFSDWQAELDRYSTESVRSKSAARLESTRQRYAQIAATLTEARQAFSPLLQSLDDQMLFLGRGLSPASVADLGPEALELNRRADDVFVTVDGLMARIRPVEEPPAVVSAD
jgi:hypothetical protein